MSARSDTEFRSGFVSILGRPNAGKSTLVNALVGEKLAAVSGLPQTTRDRINAIHTDDMMQAIFVDLPGLVEASDKLNEALRQNVIDGLEGVDCVLHLIDVTEQPPLDADIAEIVRSVSTPILAVASKIDRMPGNFNAAGWLRALGPPFEPERYEAFLGVASVVGAGLAELREAVRGFLPPGPPLYDPEALTDRNLRFLAAELIREKVFHFTHQEVPYATAVTIEAFEERPQGKWYVAATVHLERESQKGLLIGKGGAMLKKISQAARHDIEGLAGNGIFLDIHVKVSKNWRKSEMHLKQFGYDAKPGKT